MRYAGGTTTSFYYGNPGDTPLMGDWNCDGADTVAMYRESTGFVYYRNTNDFGVADGSFYFGIPGDIPIAGDWDNDGCDTFGIYRNGKVFYRNRLSTGNAALSYWFGVPGDVPFAGDFNGDGWDTVGLYRPSTGFVYFTNAIPVGNSVAPTDASFYFGIPGDRVLAGDWDGDGDDTVGIYRPSESRFYLSNENRLGIADLTVSFGQPEWLPTSGTFTALGSTPTSVEARRIDPQALSYLGAFALPGPSGGSNWEYSGYAMTYYPDGDPAGAVDGFPGSLFAVGHDHHQMVSEIAIPQPGAPGTPLDALPKAETLQPFADITNGVFGYLEIPRAGLAYVPDPEGEGEGDLYFAWGQHFEDERRPTHGVAGLNLSAANPAGPWHVGDYTNYVTNDYLFLVPESWAERYAPGIRVATGRFRDGHWSGLGPAILAIGSIAEAPPAPGESIAAIPLLMYGVPIAGRSELAIDETRAMDGFAPADEWSGGAWLTIDEQAAVVLAGTKATGENWYGFADGTVYPISGDPDEVYPEVPPWPYDQRGWWSDGTSGQLLFFDPAELGRVALGELDPWQPQPYAVLEVDEYLYDPGFDHERAKRYAVGAVAFDSERGFLYLIERRAGSLEKSVVHVFSLG